MEKVVTQTGFILFLVETNMKHKQLRVYLNSY